MAAKKGNTKLHRTLKRFMKEIRAESTQLIRDLTQELTDNIILSTPVLTGRLVGNWEASFDEPYTAFKWNKYDPGKGKVRRRTENKANRFKIGQKFHFANNLHYAGEIEFDGKSHTKAPQGMVMINIRGMQYERYAFEVIDWR